MYQADTDHYMKRDKYWGRELDEQGFKTALHRFFHNGYQLRSHVIKKVLTKLEQLRHVIEKQTSYRFYSWLVDLHAKQQQKKPETEMKLKPL